MQVRMQLPIILPVICVPLLTLQMMMIFNQRDVTLYVAVKVNVTVTMYLGIVRIFWIGRKILILEVRLSTKLFFTRAENYIKSPTTYNHTLIIMANVFVSASSHYDPSNFSFP